MGQGSIEERVRGIAERVALDHGLELVHAEVAGPENKPIVRIFIDKPDGVSVEDCATVSREIESVLDRDDFIPTSYVLEVSSPGIERELYTIADFRRFAGQRARLRTAEAIDGQRNFKGTILGVMDNVIDFEDETRGQISLPFGSVVKANLAVEMSKEFKRA